MEPNKLEQDIKKKLDARSIAPTPMAWDRLDAMLSVAEKKETKKKPIVMWLSMAACFVALLLAGIFFLNQQNGAVRNEIDNSNTVVTAPEKEANTTPAVVKGEAIVETAAPIAEVQTVVKTKKNGYKAQPGTVTIKPKDKGWSTEVEDAKEEVAVNTPTTEEKPAYVRTSKIKVDATALLASVDKPSQGSIPQGSAVAVAPGTNKKTIDVNANTLLTSVEGELDQSFRGKVINSLQRNYNTVKTAVATRNRQ